MRNSTSTWQRAAGKVRTHRTLLINVVVRSGWESCQVRRRKRGLSFCPLSPCLPTFSPLSPFQAGSSGSSQAPVHLPLCTSRYQCLPRISSCPEEISPGSSVLYWQPPPAGHRSQFLGVERDSLSRAMHRNSGLLFALPRSPISAEMWL